MYKLLLLLPLLFNQLAVADSKCEYHIQALASMQFVVEKLELEEADCDSFTFTLSNSKDSSMTHNLVIASKKEKNRISQEGFATGEANDYIQKDDPAIVAFIPLLAPGGKASITVSKDKFSPSEEYAFFCTKPGHSYIMTGDLSFFDPSMAPSEIIESFAVKK